MLLHNLSFKKCFLMLIDDSLLSNNLMKAKKEFGAMH